MKLQAKSFFVLPFVAITLATVTLSCATAESSGAYSTHKNHNFLEIMHNNTYLGVIMPKEVLPAIIPQCSRQTPENIQGSWDVTFEDISLLESQLPIFLATQGITIPNGGITNYFRQYVGIIVNSRKLIYVNAYHKTYRTDRVKYMKNTTIKKRTVENLEKNLSKYIQKNVLEIILQNINYWPANICEGGDRYFGAVYDLELSIFTELHFSHDMTGTKPGYNLHKEKPVTYPEHN